jgi:alpha-ketoglutarate-dependent taurine dioxygenase
MSTIDDRPTVTFGSRTSVTDPSIIDEVRTALRDAGAVLVRTRDGLDREQLRALGQALSDRELHGTYGDLPRLADDPEIYASTPYPARERILWHHEAAHTHEWPHVQLFRCVVAPESGGATGTADSRLIWSRLPAQATESFARLGLRYIRNFHAHLDVDWREAFGVADENGLADLCARHSITYVWQPDATLRTSLVTAATCVVDGRTAFANQILLHHPAALPAKVRDAMHGMFGEQSAFPRHVQFGDGSEIPDDLVDMILGLYDEIAVRHPWHTGDVLIVDNRTTAHSRDPYAGPRRVEVALGAFHTRPTLG